VAGREVGIDAEYIRPVPDAAEIAARSFSARENAALLRLPDDQRQEAVFRCWTRKEAFIKAIGDGLAHPLAGFDVTLTPDEPPLLSIEGDPEKAARWSLEAFVPATAYLAALAVEGPDWHSVFWQYR
jgi:4'-phosphopantetheinyl transferase